MPLIYRDIPIALIALLCAAGSAASAEGVGASRVGAEGVASGTVDLVARQFRDDVPVSVGFASGSAYLDDEARETLSQQAAWMARNPDIRFKLTGYAPREERLVAQSGLARTRAETAATFLSGRGVSRGRLVISTSTERVGGDRVETDVLEILPMAPFRIEIARSGGDVEAGADGGG